MVERELIIQLLINRIMHQLKYNEIAALTPHVVHGGTQDEFIDFMRNFIIKPLYWYRIVNAYNEAEVRASCDLGYSPKLIDDSFYSNGETIV